MRNIQHQGGASVSLQRLLGVFALAVLLCLPASAFAQDGPRFRIHGYQIEGNSLLPQDEVSLAVMPFTGPKSSFETIQLALEALEKAYLKAGYGSVKIEVPEQDLQEGVVRLLVVEARLDRVAVEGSKFRSEANILRSLPALVPEQVVNIDALQSNLDLANESFSKYTGVTFRQAEGSRQTDAVVRVNDDEPTRFLLSLDNTGSGTTGRYRLGFSYLHSNLFDRDHVLSVQLLTSPTRFNKVGILGLGYRIPLYAMGGDSMDFTLGYSNVDSGRVDLFSVSGSGLILGARYNQRLKPQGEWQQRLSYSLDQRNYDSSVTLATGGASLVPNLSVRPLGLTYSGNLRSAQRDLAASVTVTRNIPGGSRGDTAAFNQPGARAGADAGFTTLRYSASFTERLSADWSVRGALNGQYTNDLLISGEQFGVGGADSVRGFGEREVAGDRGSRVGFEIWGPDLGPRVGEAELRLQPIAFFDAGWVRYNVAPGTITSQSISSIGLGLRGSWARSASFKFDYGYVLNGARNTGGNSATARGNWRLHGSAMWVF
jgi:hemolysin activation/secretion protein